MRNEAARRIPRIEHAVSSARLQNFVGTAGVFSEKLKARLSRRSSGESGGFPALIILETVNTKCGREKRVSGRIKRY